MPLTIKTGVLNFKDDDTSTYTGIEVAKGDKGDPGPGVVYSDPNNDGHIVVTYE